MKWLTCVVVFGALSCGSETSNTQRAQAGIDQFIKSVMSDDPSQLKQMLASEELEAARRFAEKNGLTIEDALRLEFDPQRRGLIMNFGEEWISKNQIPVSDVNELGNGYFAVSLVISGATFSKPVLFKLEDGVFKFAGTTPPTTPAQNAVAAAYPYVWHNYWKFKNFSGVCASRNFHCNIQPNDNGWYYQYVASLSVNQEATGLSCYSLEYGWGSKKTSVMALGFNCPAPGQDDDDRRIACAYQIVGLDAYMATNDTLVCTTP